MFTSYHFNQLQLPLSPMLCENLSKIAVYRARMERDSIRLEFLKECLERLVRKDLIERNFFQSRVRKKQHFEILQTFIPVH